RSWPAMASRSSLRCSTSWSTTRGNISRAGSPTRIQNSRGPGTVRPAEFHLPRSAPGRVAAAGTTTAGIAATGAAVFAAAQAFAKLDSGDYRVRVDQRRRSRHRVVKQADIAGLQIAPVIALAAVAVAVLGALLQLLLEAAGAGVEAAAVIGAVALETRLGRIVDRHQPLAMRQAVPPDRRFSKRRFDLLDPRTALLGERDLGLEIAGIAPGIIRRRIARRCPFGLDHFVIHVQEPGV